MTRRRTTERCASCHAARGRMHALYCRIEDRTLFPDGPVYKAVTVDLGSSSPDSCDTSSSDSGSSCGSAC